MSASFNAEIAQYVRSELLAWIAEGKGTTSEYKSRAGTVLTPEAQADRDDFDSIDYGGCSCFVSPPCNFCVHPGNPTNQEECDECWMPALKVGAA